MELDAAARALAALSQPARLQVFRLLARAAPDGLPAGEIAGRLGIPASTLSFHLQHLTHAGLAHPRRQGRSLIYSLREGALNELLWFLGEDCCQGRPALCAAPTARIDARVADARTGSTERQTVLFLCTNNSARSQMAEAILRAEAGDRFEVHSGGLQPTGVHPLTTRVLKEAGLDTTALAAKDLGRFLGKVSIHYAVVVCEAAQADCPRLQPFALHQLYWPFPDPVATNGTKAERLEAFRTARDAIRSRVRHWLRRELPALRRGAAGRQAAGGGA